MGINARKQNLKKILGEYSAQQMKAYEEYEKMPAHSFSDGYREKMRSLEEHPIHKTGHTFAYRLAMVCICIIVALLIVNQASAYVFGMTLWDKLMESASEDMVTTVYQKKEDGKDKKGDTAGKERVHDIPTEIPEGYELVSEKNSKKGIDIKWQSNNGEQIRFTSYEIRQGIHIYENGEWESKETIVVSGYQGEFYIELAHSFLYWDDGEHRNSIISNGMSKEVLLKIAESLYEE